MKLKLYIKECNADLYRSFNMSVDVFGRHLRQVEASRGPPGIGYKITADNQYDVENKRLCNLAAPNHPSDAVNLATLQHTVQVEVLKVSEATSQLRTELNNLDVLVEVHRDEIDTKWIKLNADIQMMRDKINEKLIQFSGDIEKITGLMLESSKT